MQRDLEPPATVAAAAAYQPPIRSRRTDRDKVLRAGTHNGDARAARSALSDGATSGLIFRSMQSTQLEPLVYGWPSSS
jgi:hypothetical protein